MKRSEALMLTGAAFFGSLAPVRAQQTPIVRLGYVAVEEGAPAYYARARGFYQEAGLNVELSAFANGAAVAQGVVAGALDAGVTNSGSMSLAREHGLPLDLIACLALYTPSSPLSHVAIAKNGKMRSAKDLAGKTIAVSALRDMIHVSVMAWIDQNGGDSRASKYIEIHFPQMAQAIMAGRVDAATIVEPFFSQNRANLAELGLNYTAVNGGKPFQTLGVVANHGWASKNEDAARRLASALHAASRWANANHGEAARLLAEFTKMDPAAIAAYPRVTFAESNEPGYVQPVIDMMARYSVLQEFNAAQLFARGVA
jgi:NitT/TauT family transport system substrate-binding protein